MRVTNGMIIKRYSKNLNSNLNLMNRTSQQIASGRRFERGSEDPVSALKSLQVRRSGNALEQYSKNIDTVESWLSQTETAVLAVKTSADKAMDLIIQGRNDTLAPEDRAIIAASLRSIQEALLKDLNTQIAGKYLLGGSNTKTVPFTVNDEGHLIFNGVNVFEANDFEDTDIMEAMQPIYVDLTGEFKYTDDNLDEFVDKSTVFDMYTAGISIIGVGPNNLYNLIGRIADSFESEYQYEKLYHPNGDPVLDTITGEHIIGAAGIDRMQDIDGPVIAATDPNDPFFKNRDFDSFNAYQGDVGLFKRLQDKQQNAIIELVKVGEKSNFINYLQERTGNSLYEAQLMQNKLELIPPDEAILKFKMQDYVYKACLQMSSYIFQPSLMDFLRR